MTVMNRTGIFATAAAVFGRSIPAKIIRVLTGNITTVRAVLLPPTLSFLGYIFKMYGDQMQGRTGR
jgi:hypothetical protein